jgi:hypothetical protein
MAYCGLGLRKCALDRKKIHVAGGRKQMKHVLIEQEEEEEEELKMLTRVGGSPCFVFCFSTFLMLHILASFVVLI